ncbi:hypothetical protein [Streptomyces kanamyceticus]|uniref:Uncharacterized protein n=1 Tax=Streptomyces kanamyceticus TaxID=1967 RepID=A0A5J6GDT5_STRKN|nr:hypothetical protein [Streptomyces kanamyceticus]QEU91376.1 hypothetical protein CP970_11195 [Streptomyces kanamyceticus]
MLTNRIKVGIGRLWEDVQAAYAGRAWAALGYRTWDRYCREEFGSAAIRIPLEERPEVVESLRSAGLSNRAVASVTGLSEATVRRTAQGASSGAPETVVGTDGKHYPARHLSVVRNDLVPEPKKRQRTREGWKRVMIADIERGHAGGLPFLLGIFEEHADIIRELPADLLDNFVTTLKQEEEASRRLRKLIEERRGGVS